MFGDKFVDFFEKKKENTKKLYFFPQGAGKKK